MIFNKLLIKAAAPIPKVDKYERYLFVAPHPDDIEIAAGSTVAKLCAEKKEVIYLICTDGRYGTEDKNLKPSELVKIRQAEQKKAADILGVKQVIFLPFEDGGLYSAEDMQVEVAKVIARVKPDVVLTADYQLYSECHPDHQKVGRATANAYFLASNYHFLKDNGEDEIASPKALVFFYTGHPNYYVKTGKYYNKMVEAMQSFKSQFTDESLKSLMLYTNIKTRLNGVKKFSTHADGFRSMNNLHIHCCADIDK